MTVPEVLKRHGIARQTDLARVLEVHHQAAQRIWSGKVRIGRINLERLVKAGVPADELLQASGGESIYRKRQPA